MKYLQKYIGHKKNLVRHAMFKCQKIKSTMRGIGKKMSNIEVLEWVIMIYENSKKRE